jgi:hypothetical protein
MGFFGRLFGFVHKKCKSQVKQLEESVIELQHDAKIAELDYKSEKLNLDSVISKLSSEYTTLEDQNKSLASKNKELNESKQDFDKKLLLETEKIKGLEKILENKKSIIQEKESVIKAREEELISSDSKNQENEEKRYELSRKITELEKDYTMLQINYKNALKNTEQNKLQFELKQKESKQDYDKKLYALQIQLSREYERQYGAKCSQTVQKFFKVYLSLRHSYRSSDIMHPMNNIFRQLDTVDKQNYFLDSLDNARASGEASVREVFKQHGQELKQINSQYQNGNQSQDSQHQNHQS